MSKHITFGKIGQYDQMVRAIKMQSHYKGKDENGDAIYDESLPVPKLKVSGTVKLHGSNAAVTYQDGEYLCQSRNNIVSTGHFSFPEIINQEKEHVRSMFESIRERYSAEESEIITVFGEIVGPGIQKSVALNELSKKYWIVFAVKITDRDGEGRWQSIREIACESDRIFNIYDFPTFETDIDFACAKESQNFLVEKCSEIEKCCPVAKQLENINGTGEGIVIETFYRGIRHVGKIKGDKHAAGSKVKTLAQVDPVVLTSIQMLVDHAVTESRVVQAMHEIGQEVNEPLNKKHTGKVINWVARDIIAEESHVLKENNLEYAQAASTISTEVRKIYFKKLENL